MGLAALGSDGDARHTGRNAVGPLGSRAEGDNVGYRESADAARALPTMVAAVIARSLTVNEIASESGREPAERGAGSRFVRP